MQIEGTIARCKDCGLEQVRKHSGYDKKGWRRFVNEAGLYWHGRKCPDCNSLDQRQYKQEHREEQAVVQAAWRDRNRGPGGKHAKDLTEWLDIPQLVGGRI